MAVCRGGSWVAGLALPFRAQSALWGGPAARAGFCLSVAGTHPVALRPAELSAERRSSLPGQAVVRRPSVIAGGGGHSSSLHVLACCTPHAACCTPHAACRTLHAACSTRHAACSMLHAARRMLHAARIPCAACRTLHAACSMQHTARSTLHAVCCLLHAARCTLHAVRCTLHAACCMLHAACCMLHVLITMPLAAARHCRMCAVRLCAQICMCSHALARCRGA